MDPRVPEARPRRPTCAVAPSAPVNRSMIQRAATGTNRNSCGFRRGLERIAVARIGSPHAPRGSKPAVRLGRQAWPFRGRGQRHHQPLGRNRCPLKMKDNRQRSVFAGLGDQRRPSVAVCECFAIGGRGGPADAFDRCGRQPQQIDGLRFGAECCSQHLKHRDPNDACQSKSAPGLSHDGNLPKRVR